MTENEERTVLAALRTALGYGSREDRIAALLHHPIASVAVMMTSFRYRGLVEYNTVPPIAPITPSAIDKN